MTKLSLKILGPILVALVMVILIAGGFYWTYEQTKNLDARVALLEGDLASTTLALKSNLDATSQALDEQKESVGTISKNLDKFQDEVGDISGTVNTLEKLSKTDPELLQKYSKVFFLNEHYAPARLTEIPAEYRYSDAKSLSLHAQVWPFLKKLLDRAKRDNVELFVDSAYRSFEEQSALKSRYKVTYGAGSANQFSADQGYSEHQLGTTVDFITTGTGGQLDGFEKTKAYEWLLANAARYGFTLSYPSGNQYYVFEPWHWRFVGTDLAEDLQDEKAHFYDWDQR